MCIICKNKQKMATICKSCKDSKFINENKINCYFHLTKTEYVSLFTANDRYLRVYLIKDIINKFSEIFKSIDTIDDRYYKMYQTKKYLDQIIKYPNIKFDSNDVILKMEELKNAEIINELKIFESKLSNKISNESIRYYLHKYQSDSDFPKFIAMKIFIEADTKENTFK